MKSPSLNFPFSFISQSEEIIRRRMVHSDNAWEKMLVKIYFRKQAEMKSSGLKCRHTWTTCETQLWHERVSQKKKGQVGIEDAEWERPAQGTYNLWIFSVFGSMSSGRVIENKHFARKDWRQKRRGSPWISVTALPYVSQGRGAIENTDSSGQQHLLKKKKCGEIFVMGLPRRE